MRFFRDYLYGKDLTYHDSKIGVLRSKVKDPGLPGAYTWHGEILLEGQKEKTVITVFGDVSGPYEQQLKCVFQVIDGIYEIYDFIDTKMRELEAEGVSYETNWQEMCYTSAILSSSEKQPSFDLNFERLLNKNEGYVWCFWENGNITEFEAW